MVEAEDHPAGVPERCVELSEGFDRERSGHVMGERHVDVGNDRVAGVDGTSKAPAEDSSVRRSHVRSWALCPADDQCVEVRAVQRTIVAAALHLGREPAQALVVEVDAECRGPVADCMTAGEAVSGEDAAFPAEPRRLEYLVGSGVGEDGLGVHPRLVVERGRCGDRCVEGDRDAEDLGEHRIELGQQLQPVVLDELGLQRMQPRHHRGERDDPVALADAENGGVDVRCTRLEGGERIRDGATRVVVGVELDVTADVAANQRDEIVDLGGGRHADRVREPDAIRARRVDGPIDTDEVLGVGAERVPRC